MLLAAAADTMGLGLAAFTVPFEFRFADRVCATRRCREWARSRREAGARPVGQ
jgi:hypothetical protein